MRSTRRCQCCCDPTDATNAGLSICQRLEKGDSFDTAIDSETAAGYSEHDAGFIVGAAVKNLCPDLVPALNQWLQKPETRAVAAGPARLHTALRVIVPPLNTCLGCHNRG